METPDAESLRQLPYSELKKLAKSRGLKTNVKAERLIKAILSKNIEESFQDLEQNIINSSRKNKEAKFDEDKKVIMDTPRRGTYTLDSPMTEVLKETISTSKKSGERSLAESIVDSPMTEILKKKENILDKKKKPVSEIRRDESNIVDSAISFIAAAVTAATTPTPKKSFDANTSKNISLIRGSEKKPRKHKVSFVTPAKRASASSPHRYMSLKDRPKTPIPSRISSGRKVSFITPDKSAKKSLERRKSQPSTPYPSDSSAKNSKIRRESSLKSVIEVETKDSESCESEAEQFHTPMTRSSPRLISQNDSVEQKSAKQGSVDKKTFKSATKFEVAKAKRIGTPNFKKMHQKTFDKMESIDDYLKRKAKNSAHKLGNQVEQKPFVAKKTTEIPKAFSGIPFVASVRNRKLKSPKVSTNAVKRTSVHSAKSSALSQAKSSALSQSSLSENTLNPRSTRSTSRKSAVLPSGRVKAGRESIQRKSKFDLQASLAKKLPYKPHRGPLKPLSEVNLNSSILSTSCFHKKNEPEKPVVTNIRMKNRDVLRGVRKNRRFDLQMKNRKM